MDMLVVPTISFRLLYAGGLEATSIGDFGSLRLFAGN
jgi:hypothetical protein